MNLLILYYQHFGSGSAFNLYLGSGPKCRSGSRVFTLVHKFRHSLKFESTNRGRGFSFKMYLPQKPSRYGFLFKSLGDSINAYIFRSHIYAGRPVREPTEHYIQGNSVLTSIVYYSLIHRVYRYLLMVIMNLDLNHVRILRIQKTD